MRASVVRTTSTGETSRRRSLLGVCSCILRSVRQTEAAHVVSDYPARSGQLSHLRVPATDATGETVDQDERGAVACFLVVQLDAVDAGDRHATIFQGVVSGRGSRPAHRGSAKPIVRQGSSPYFVPDEKHVRRRRAHMPCDAEAGTGAHCYQDQVCETVLVWEEVPS